MQKFKKENKGTQSEENWFEESNPILIHDIFKLLFSTSIKLLFALETLKIFLKIQKN
jgi:hypothetical protein